jgi:hypothetical protein
MTAIAAMIVLGLAAAHKSMAEQPEGETTARLCSAPDVYQFDVWGGHWNLTWGDSATGTNTITKEYDDCVIIERFDGTPATPFKGMSVSTFNKKLGKWQQTWVDNQGGYLDFTGEYSNGKMILAREASIEGKTEWQRMVWHNITENSLDWNWEKSSDGGQSWETAWQIHYHRVQ